MLPNYDNQVSLDPELTDQWGLPLLRVNCEFGPNAYEMRKDMKASAGEMLEAAGLENVVALRQH